MSIDTNRPEGTPGEKSPEAPDAETREPQTEDETLKTVGEGSSSSEEIIEDLPSPEELPEVKIYSHSSLFYWWPAWVVGYVMAALSYFRGGVIELDEVRNEWFHQSSAPGLIFVSILLFLIFFTNVKLRGIYSITLIIAGLLIVTLIAWAGWWDDIAAIIPLISIHMNAGFYLVFSTGLLILWALMFFIFDRMTWYRIRPGQMIQERIIGSGEKSYDTKGMLFEQEAEDFFRHKIIGLGSGDLVLKTSGARKEDIVVRNVLFVERKVDAIQRLVAVKPDDMLPSND